MSLYFRLDRIYIFASDTPTETRKLQRILKNIGLQLEMVDRSHSRFMDAYCSKDTTRDCERH